MRTKLPELRREVTRDTDCSKKLKGKEYADSKGGAVPTFFRVGDAVLLENKQN